jgi:phage shock protein PspC (stress-responsive transcriptional regulator)
MTRARTGLQRSQDDRIIAGVCGGVAEWLGWDPTLVRVLFVLVSIFSAAFPGILVYLILWIVMPERPDVLTDIVDYD